MKHKLYIVDPHRNHSEVVSQLQKDNRFLITKVVGSGDEVTVDLHDIDADTILINYQLPDMLGTSVVKFIKRFNQSISIFIYSSEMSMNVWREVSKVGATMLPIPIDIEHFLQVLGNSAENVQSKKQGSRSEDTQELAGIKAIDEVAASASQEEPIQDEVIFEDATDDIPEFSKKAMQTEEKTTIVTNLEAKKRKPKQKKKPKQREGGIIVTVFSPKGGVGKTTTSVNLATLIQTYTEKRVALIELTRQSGNMLSHFALTPTVTLNDWVRKMPDIEEVTEYLIEDPGTGLHILPTQPLLQEVQNPIKITSKQIVQMLPLLKETYDVVVIDGGTILDQILMEIISQSDFALLVSKVDNEALQLCHYLPEILARRGIETDKVIHVLNQCKKGLGMTENEALDMVNLDLEHVIQYEADVEKIRNDREPFVVSKPKSMYTKQIKQLAALITGDEDLEEQLPVYKKWLAKVGL